MRLYADDIAVICPIAESARKTDDHIKRELNKYGLTINYGPNKSCYMQTSPAAKRHTEKIGQLERVESYQYLGSLMKVDRRNSINYRGLTKAQSGCRNVKLRTISKKFSWMLSNRKTTAGAINDLILALTRGNLYPSDEPQKSNLNKFFRMEKEKI